MSEYYSRIASRYITLDSPYWLREFSGDLFVTFLRFFHFRAVQSRIFLASSQWWNRPKIERYQEQKLRRLLGHSYKNVPYYFDIFRKNKLSPDDITSLADLRKLPILTKEDVVRNYDKLLVRKADKKKLILSFTSGTTGTPMCFYREFSGEPLDFLFYYRSLEAVGLNVYDRGIRIWLRDFISDDVKERYIYKPYLKRLTLASFYHGAPILGEKIDLIRRFRPAYLLASPSLLNDLACYVEERLIESLGIKCIISSFENITLSQRQRIEKAFGCKVYNLYMMQERAISAFECREQTGMHLDMERSVTEIVDDIGNSLPDGSAGRLVTTNLHIFSMPLIRYDTGDVGSISETPCRCGRGLSLLRSFDGRASEAIRYKGKTASSSALSNVLFEFNAIKECQFVQDKEEEVVVNIVKRDHFSSDDARKLKRYIHGLLSDGLEVRLNFVNNIPRTTMGKFPFVLSRLR